jgi:AraC-like DNA-binding protein
MSLLFFRMHKSADDRVFIKYLTHSPTDEAWQIYCTGAGHGETPAGSSYPPSPDLHPPEYLGELSSRGRTLNEYQLVYLTAGRGHFRCEGGVGIEVEAGAAFLLFPGLRHSYAPLRETGWSEYWVGFRGAYPEALQRAGFLSPREPVYRPGLDLGLFEDYRLIFELAEAEPPGFQQLIGAAIVQMLARLASGTKAERQDSEAEETVRRVKFLMEERLYGWLDVETVEERLGLPYHRYSVLFHEYTGLSPHQYFLQLKINRAKLLLAEPRASVKETALRLGFESEFYFSRLFKKKTGLSPSAWKASRSSSS